MIRFVNNYDDLSTDKGFQFKFHCDKCGNGFMSKFQYSTVGVAGSLLRAAGDLFDGWMSWAGNSTYEIQRAVGGPAHDAAVKAAVEESKQHFHQCSRCGKLVCPEVCWNEKAKKCEECAPDFQEGLASSQAHARADAAWQQLYEKAQQTDYVSNVDMSAGAQVSAPLSVKPEQSANTCASCGCALKGAKFCPECGTPARPARPTCQACGHQPQTPTKYCLEWGNKLVS